MYFEYLYILVIIEFSVYCSPLKVLDSIYYVVQSSEKEPHRVAEAQARVTSHGILSPITNLQPATYNLSTFNLHFLNLRLN